MLMQNNEIGKMATLLSISTEDQEKNIMNLISSVDKNIKMGISFVAGPANDAKDKFINNLIGCAVNNNIVESENTTQIHGLLHAGLEAFESFSHKGLLYGHLKLKMAIVRNGSWLAVALYGYSSINKRSNHERLGMGISHV